MLDTGFTGYLAMPPALVAALSLPFTNYHNATLAHGRVVRVDVHEATVLWDGEERMVSVLAIGHDPLIGMSLMDGSEVHLQVADGGSIMIEPL
jgi:clan AA aspartic protease